VSRLLNTFDILFTLRGGEDINADATVRDMSAQAVVADVVNRVEVPAVAIE
jgi:hypothetical protein